MIRSGVRRPRPTSGHRPRAAARTNPAGSRTRTVVREFHPGRIEFGEVVQGGEAGEHVGRVRFQHLADVQVPQAGQVRGGAEGESVRQVARVHAVAPPDGERPDPRSGRVGGEGGALPDGLLLAVPPQFDGPDGVPLVQFVGQGEELHDRRGHLLDEPAAKVERPGSAAGNPFGAVGQQQAALAGGEGGVPRVVVGQPARGSPRATAFFTGPAAAGDVPMVTSRVRTS